MHEQPAVGPERSDELPENNRLTKRVSSGVVRQDDRWLTPRRQLALRGREGQFPKTWFASPLGL